MAPRPGFLGGRRSASRPAHSSASSSLTITPCSATPTHSRPLRRLTHRREEGPMRPLTGGTSLAAGLFAPGCTHGPPTAPGGRGPPVENSHAAPTHGPPGCYFLAPHVRGPTFTGTF